MKQHIKLHVLKYIFVCTMLVCCFLIYTFADVYEYSFLTSREYVDGVLGATDATGARIEYVCYDSDGEYIVDRTVVPYQNIRFEYDRVKCNVYPSRLPSNTATLSISYPAPCIKNVANYIGYLVIKELIICTPYDLSLGNVRMYADCVGDDGSEMIYFITDFDGVMQTQTDAGNGYYLYTSDSADYQFFLDSDVASFQGIRLEFDNISSGAFTSLSYGTTYFSFKMNTNQAQLNNSNDDDNLMAKQQKMMTILMVALIGFMSFSLPTAIAVAPPTAPVAFAIAATIFAAAPAAASAFIRSLTISQ